MSSSFWVKLRVLLSVAVLGAGATEVVFFALSQAYSSPDVPAWAFTPWWVVLIRSTIPLVVYKIVTYARVCERMQRHDFLMETYRKHEMEAGR